MLSPVVVLAYKREEHIKQVLDALSENTLADQTEVFVFSNAANPSNENENEIVANIRKLLFTYKKKFGKYQVIERTHYLECNESITSAIDSVIKQYGKVIVIEDDMVVQPNFLSFMNQALDYYQSDQSVFHISGYNPMNEKGGVEEIETFLTHSFMPWGWGTWSDRWNMVDWDRKVENLKKIDRTFAKKNAPMFEMSIRRDILGCNTQKMYWDYTYSCTQLRLKASTVYPTVSMVRNIGKDGTGETSKDQIDMNDRKPDKQVKTDQFLFTNTPITEKFAPAYVHDFIDKLYYGKVRDQQFVAANENYNLLYTWISMKNENQSAAYYFETRNYKKIAVYGMGFIGNVLCDDLRNSTITVSYGIDKSNVTVQKDLRLLPIDHLEEVDAVVVTVTKYYDSIKKELEKQLSCDILSIEDIIYDCAIELGIERI